MFKDCGDKDKAVQAYMKYSLCSDKINELYGVADGLIKAAFCERDKKKSFKLLQDALNFYKI